MEKTLFNFFQLMKNINFIQHCPVQYRNTIYRLPKRIKFSINIFNKFMTYFSYKIFTLSSFNNFFYLDEYTPDDYIIKLEYNEHSSSFDIILKQKYTTITQ